MSHTLTATDAKRKFSRLLRGVREGRAYVITRYGRPVARVVPADRYERVTAAARKVLFERLRVQAPLEIERWTRDELYENER